MFTRISPGLMDDNKVGHFVCPAGFYQLLHLVATPVHPLGVGEDQTHLLHRRQGLQLRLPSPKLARVYLGELFELGTGVPGSGDDNLRVPHTRPAVLVILLAHHAFEKN